MERRDLPLHGRGATLNPTNRFERLVYVPEPDFPEPDVPAEDRPAARTEFYRDDTRSIIASNDSPDVGFDASVNPYRGCEHGCIYCFARPFQEYLGFSAGLDFETKILVKERAPELLRAELMSPRWTPQVLGFSGVTDAYQPIERRLRITRRCLEVLAEFRNPVAIITKSRLVVRDADVLGELARHQAACVNFSVTTLDPALAEVMEPRATRPEGRLAAIAELSAAGVPVNVLVAPVIPGLNDHEIPAILRAVRQAGAVSASYVFVRLPYGVGELFDAWLDQHFPQKKDKILGRIRDSRGGKLYDSRWSIRQKGEGPVAEMVRQVFEKSYRRQGFPGGPELSTAAFRRPGETPLRLFD